MGYQKNKITYNKHSSIFRATDAVIEMVKNEILKTAYIPEELRDVIKIVVDKNGNSKIVPIKKKINGKMC